MNSFYKLVIRLILGIFFGILLTRIFKPDWPLYWGAGVGIILAGIAYLTEFLRRRKT